MSAHLRGRQSWVTGAVVLIAVAIVLVGSRGPHPRGHATPTASERVAASSVEVPEAPLAALGRPGAAEETFHEVARRPTAEVSALSERELMGTLRRLGHSDPAQTLALADAADERFGKSGDAAERAAARVRALTSLDRREHARAEAVRMTEEFPSSPFTSNVYRHMFVNPPTHPLERGFGKSSELDP